MTLIRDICIHKKDQDGRPCFFIQYLGIPIHHFVQFLETHHYPVELRHHVKENIEHYADLEHEITEVFDAETLTFIRSLFCGVL